MINMSLKTEPAAMTVTSTEATDAHQGTSTDNPAVPANLETHPPQSLPMKNYPL